MVTQSIGNDSTSDPEGNEKTDINHASMGYTHQNKMESIPLKSYWSVYKKRSCLGEGYGLKVIILCCVVFTIAITIALIVQIYHGEHQVTPHGSVATDNKECSVIGTKVLQKGGNAVDAAIASTICMGVVHPHVTGIGGGGFMAIHDQKRDYTKIIDFRETAPSAVTPEDYTEDPLLARVGGLAVGVPGLLRGLEHAYKQSGSGKVSWKYLLSHSVKLARKGFPASKYLVEAATTKLTPAELQGNQHLLQLLKPDGALITERQLVTRPMLASLLHNVAINGTGVFYDGVFSTEIVNEVKNSKGVLVTDDLKKYTAVEHEALTSVFKDYSVFTSGAPSGGPQLLMLLNVLEGFNFTPEDPYTEDVETLHRMLEAIRLTAEPQSHLGDPDLVPTVQNLTSMMMNKSEAAALRQQIQDSILPPVFVPTIPEPAGSQVSVMDANDLYVSVISSINTWFGSKVMTSSGILLNNAMANFYHPSLTKEQDMINIVARGRRPLSPAAPVIIVHSRDVCKRRVVLGAADSMLAAEVILNMLTFRESLTISIEEPHLLPDPGSDKVIIEDDHDQKLAGLVRTNLTAMGYQLTSRRRPYPSINVVQKIMDVLASHSDSRGGGVASRF